MQTLVALAIAVVFAAVGALTRRALAKRFRFNVTGWFAAVAALSVGATVSIYYGLPPDHAAFRAIAILMMSFIAFGLLWAGAAALGGERVDWVMILLFCVAALVIMVSGAAGFFVFAWGGAHGGSPLLPRPTSS